ncbi:MAG TPA: RES family NAD+ phosphorylase [Caulobacteraceae bacterium]
MSRLIWRIATDTPAYEADDLSGRGAEATGGRWNARGTPVVYASETRSLACLETLVHLNASGLPLNRYLVAVEAPDAVWSAAERLDAASLPVGWDAEPPGRVSIDLGTAWLRSSRSALLVVPSVIVPEELNVLINPGHPDSRSITATKVRRWLYDPRLG